MLEDAPPRGPGTRSAPAERLGGALAVIYWASVAILLLPVIGLGSLAVTAGHNGLALMLAQALGGPRHLLVGMAPLLVLIIWAAAFVAMTAVRARAAPAIASILFALWGLSSIAAQIGIQLLLIPNGPNLATLGPLLPSLAATAVFVAAFWGYMREGERPRRWFSGT